MIRVLLVDDSALMRYRFTDILEADPEIEVIAHARNGLEAIDKAVKLKPDVIVMDLNMTEVDGFAALDYLMDQFPVPVVISIATENRINETRALEMGAVAIVNKPRAATKSDDKNIISQVKAASRVNAGQIRALLARRALQADGDSEVELAGEIKRLVVLGASTGGPKAIKEILPYFPKNIPAAFLIVQHMPVEFTASMAERLNGISQIEVREAKDGDIVRPGHAYIAPGGFHMIARDEKGACVLRLNQDPAVHSVRPSASVTMRAAAACFREKTVGVLLTGMGSDGVEGMEEIKRLGGVTLVQEESSCVVFGMPKAAIIRGVVDKTVALQHMGMEIIKIIES